MRNRTKHKMMPLLSPFMTYVLSRLFCQMCRSRDCSGLFLYPTGLTGQLILIPNPIYIEKKRYTLDLEQELPSLLQSYELRGKQPSLILVASYDMPWKKAEVLFYTEKTLRDPTGIINLKPLYSQFKGRL